MDTCSLRRNMEIKGENVGGGEDYQLVCPPSLSFSFLSSLSLSFPSLLSVFPFSVSFPSSLFFSV